MRLLPFVQLGGGAIATHTNPSEVAVASVPADLTTTQPLPTITVDPRCEAHHLGPCGLQANHDHTVPARPTGPEPTRRQARSVGLAATAYFVMVAGWWVAGPVLGNGPGLGVITVGIILALANLVSLFVVSTLNDGRPNSHSYMAELIEVQRAAAAAGRPAPGAMPWPVPLGSEDWPTSLDR